MRRKLYLTGSFCLCLLLQSCGQSTDKAYALMLKGLYNNTVPVITPTQLNSQLQQKSPPVLLDTRSEKEFKVSHLTSARFVGYGDLNLSQLQDLPKDATIVVYCSVGYRSERVGEKLQEAGYKNVKNLYGGIFEWINQGHPVYNKKSKTDKVHAYSRSWGVWLRKGEKVYE